MPDLHVRKITKFAPACESGRHLVHPFYECDEVDELAQAFAGLYEQALTEAYAEAHAEVDQWLLGSGTGEICGIAGWKPSEPTPIERALAILDPELRACPLYDAGPPAVYGPA